MSVSTASLQRKMNSAGDLQSVVRTMKALAASQIGQYEKSVLALADYYRTVEIALGECLRQRYPTVVNAERKGQTQVDSIGAIVFGSDQGLVGPFNDVVADLAIKTLAELPGKARVWAVGERVQDRLSGTAVPVEKVFVVPNSVDGIGPLVSQIQIDSEAHREKGGNVSVYVFHNRPRAGTGYEPVSRRLLPLDAQWRQSLTQVPWPESRVSEVIGSDDKTLRVLIREYLFISLYRACAESLASENASRLAAMARADKNIEDLQETLQETFQRARQGKIDEELFDVIAGFQAVIGQRS